MKTRPTSVRRSSDRPVPSRRPTTSSRWAAVGALAASAALVGRVSAASVQLPPEFRARVVDPLPAAWLRDDRHAAPHVTIGPAAMHADDQQPAVTRFDIPPGPLSTVIKAFEQVTGYTVTLADAALGDIPSPGVAGVTSVDRALAALLDGTGVNARETGIRAVTLAISGVNETLDVTATARVASVRYARPVSETPQTIQVIPRQVMEAQGVTTLSEALRNVPGISLQAGEGGGASSTTGDMFNLRGFSANNSLFVDGVRDDGLIARDVFNLEQVEVFLGPTGTDVGRGNAAGYVNMTTKTPAVQTRYAGMATPRHRRSARGCRSISTRRCRRQSAGLVAGGNRSPAQRAQAGQRRPRARRGPAAHTGVRAVAGARPGHAHAARRRRPVHRAGQRAGLRHPRRRVAGIAAGADDRPRSARRSTSRISTARPPTTTTWSRRTARSPAFEHDLKPTLQLRHQFRHNKAHRSALISTVQNPAAYNAATGQVTVARQGNERENRITANQTSVSAVGRTGRATHALTGTLEFTREAQFAPTLTGFGTRGTADIFHPDVNTPVSGVAVGAHRARSATARPTRSPSPRSMPSTSVRGCRSPAGCGSSATTPASCRSTRPA